MNEILGQASTAPTVAAAILLGAVNNNYNDDNDNDTTKEYGRVGNRKAHTESFIFQQCSFPSVWLVASDLRTLTKIICIYNEKYQNNDFHDRSAMEGAA